MELMKSDTSRCVPPGLEPEIIERMNPGQTVIGQHRTAGGGRGVGEEQSFGAGLARDGTDALFEDPGVTRQENHIFRLDPDITPPLGLFAPGRVHKGVHGAGPLGMHRKVVNRVERVIAAPE